MENVLFKISFPAEFHAQTAVECAMALHPRVRDRIDEIRTITIRTHESAIRIIDKKGPLANPADRDHCIQYMVAVPLMHGRLTAADYEDDIAADPRIDALRDKMICVEDTQFSQRLPRSRQALDRQRDHRRVRRRQQARRSRRRISDRTSPPPRRGHPAAGRKVPDQSRAALPAEAAAGDRRRRARRRPARRDAGARVRRPVRHLTPVDTRPEPCHAKPSIPAFPHPPAHGARLAIALAIACARSRRRERVRCRPAGAQVGAVGGLAQHQPAAGDQAPDDDVPRRIGAGRDARVRPGCRQGDVLEERSPRRGQSADRRRHLQARRDDHEDALGDDVLRQHVLPHRGQRNLRSAVA